jgi:hypothetical protein
VAFGVKRPGVSEKGIVHLPETTLLSGTRGGNSGSPGKGMNGLEREVPHKEADLTGLNEFFVQLDADAAGERLAERTLEV